MEQKNELYHYGRKGMKWGQHKFGKEDLKALWDKRITGEYYLNNRSTISNSPGRPNGQNNFKYGTGNTTRGYQGHMADRHQRLTESKWIRESSDGYLGGRSEGLKAARRMNIEGRRSENRANQMLQNYYHKSLKGIAESTTKKAKNWISSRSAAAKKKVSEIKEKVAKAESGKKTVTYPLSRDANKKKRKKSTVKSSSHYMSNY